MRLLLTLMAVAVLTISVGCAPKPEAAKPTTPAAPAAETSSSATTPATGDLQLVSLKLPNMT